MQQLARALPVTGSVSERLTFRRSEEMPDTSAKKTRPAETKQDIQKDTAETAGNAAADSAQPESGASAESIGAAAGKKRNRRGRTRRNRAPMPPQSIRKRQTFAKLHRFSPKTATALHRKPQKFSRKAT